MFVRYPWRWFQHGFWMMSHGRVWFCRAMLAFHDRNLRDWNLFTQLLPPFCRKVWGHSTTLRFFWCRFLKSVGGSHHLISSSCLQWAFTSQFSTANEFLRFRVFFPRFFHQVRYTWHLDDSSWTLEVQLPLSAPETCPVLDVSEAQVRLSAEGGQILCVPLPEGEMAAPVPKWLRKKRLLSMKFAKINGGWRKMPWRHSMVSFGFVWDHFFEVSMFYWGQCFCRERF